MANFPSDVLLDVQRGKSFLSGLDAEDTVNLIRGCSDCSVTNYDCLASLMMSIGFKVESDEYDDDAKSVIEKILIIIGDYNVQMPPTVVVSPSTQTVQVGTDAIFTAVATPGSAPIVSHQWIKVSGGALTLLNANTAEVTVTGFGAGNFVIKDTVIDQNGLTGSGNGTLIGQALQVQIFYDAFDSEPDLTTVVLTKSFFVAAGSSEFTIPFGIASNNKYIVWSQPQAEPDKVNWFNTVLNYGTVPDGAMKAKIISGGKDIIGSRDIFSFDSSNYTLKVTT